MSGRVPGQAWPVLGGALWSAVVVVMARRSRPPARVRGMVRVATERTGGRADADAPEPVRTAGARATEAVAGGLGRGLRRIAGRPPHPILDRRAGWAAIATVALGVVVPWLGMAAGAVAWVIPWAVARRVERRRLDRVQAELPDVVDLLRLAVGAGYSARLAILVVAERAAGSVGEALGRVHGRLERGQGLADALAELDPLGEPVRPLVDALRATDRHGAPLVPILTRLSADARSTRRRRAEERARRVPVVLLFPLVFCTLPAFGLLTVVPFLASALGHLSF